MWYGEPSTTAGSVYQRRKTFYKVLIVLTALYDYVYNTRIRLLLEHGEVMNKIFGVQTAGSV
jgi:hypothetical protein